MYLYFHNSRIQSSSVRTFVLWILRSSRSFHLMPILPSQADPFISYQSFHLMPILPSHANPSISCRSFHLMPILPSHADPSISCPSFHLMPILPSHTDPSHADLQINIIPIWYPLMFIPCRANLNWDIRHVILKYIIEFKTIYKQRSL